MTDPTPIDSTEQAKRLLEANGYVILKAKSYQRAQERQRLAQALWESAQRDRAHTREWAFSIFDEQRRLADRLTFVYGVARSHGASVEELNGTTGFEASDD